MNESEVVRGAVSFLEASLDGSTHGGVAGGEEVVGLALLGGEDGRGRSQSGDGKGGDEHP